MIALPFFTLYFKARFEINLEYFDFTLNHEFQLLLFIIDYVNFLPITRLSSLSVFSHYTIIV